MRKLWSFLAHACIVCARSGVATAAGLIAVMSGVLAAQQPMGGATSTDPHRHALLLMADVGTVPDVFSSRCANRGASGAYGGGLSALFRHGSMLVLQGDLRATGSIPLPGGCNVALIVPPGATKDDLYPKSIPRTPLLRSAVALGLETPPGYPLVRATLGGGMIVAPARAFYRTTAIGVGTRSKGARFYAEFETSVSRARRGVVRFVPLGDSASIVLVPTVEHPRWSAVRAGVELPIARAR